jgi:hypothetical protein
MGSFARNGKLVAADRRLSEPGCVRLPRRQNRGTNDVLMRAEFVHLPAELVSISVEGLDILNAPSDHAAHFPTPELLEDLESDVSVTGSHTEHVGAATPVGPQVKGPAS